MICPRWTKVANRDGSCETSLSLILSRKKPKPLVRFLSSSTLQTSSSTSSTKSSKAINNMSPTTPTTGIKSRFKKKWDRFTGKTRQEQLDKMMEMLKDLTGVDAGTMANKLTISLVDNENDLIGHGILLECNDPNDSNQPERFAIVTAAHVAVDANTYFHQGDFAKIRFSSSTGTEYEINYDDTAKLYFADDYLLKGTVDVGALVVSFKPDGPQPTSKIDLVISDDDGLSANYTGQNATCRIRSNAFTLIGNRVMLSHASKPGCSGMPMFSPRGEILALLHGESKHRRRRRHSADAGESSDDGISSRVYVDLLRGFHGLKFWHEDLRSVLNNLEFVEEIHTANPTQRLFQPNGTLFRDEDNRQPNNQVIEQVIEQEDEQVYEQVYEQPNNNGIKVAGQAAKNFHDSVIEFFGEENRDPVMRERLTAKKGFFTIEELCVAIQIHASRIRLRGDAKPLFDLLKPSSSNPAHFVAFASPARPNPGLV